MFLPIKSLNYSRGVPLWAAIAISLRVAEQYVEELQAVQWEYVDGVYETIEANSWFKALNDCLKRCVEDILNGITTVPRKDKFQCIFDYWQLFFV